MEVEAAQAGEGQCGAVAAVGRGQTERGEVWGCADEGFDGGEVDGVAVAGDVEVVDFEGVEVGEGEDGGVGGGGGSGREELGEDGQLPVVVEGEA